MPHFLFALFVFFLAFAMSAHADETEATENETEVAESSEDKTRKATGLNLHGVSFELGEFSGIGYSFEFAVGENGPGGRFLHTLIGEIHYRTFDRVQVDRVINGVKVSTSGDNGFSGDFLWNFKLKKEGWVPYGQLGISYIGVSFGGLSTDGHKVRSCQVTGDSIGPKIGVGLQKKINASWFIQTGYNYTSHKVKTSLDGGDLGLCFVGTAGADNFHGTSLGSTKINGSNIFLKFVTDWNI